MAKGISLHVGLNDVDPDHYAGGLPTLKACEADAGDMRLIAESRDFDATMLLTREATRDAVLGAIASAASSLHSGDIFLISVSSHGGQVPDRNGDEPDGQDETWCLYDGELIDDELYAALCAFEAGVRVLVVSDTCHSGSIITTPLMVALYGGLLNDAGERFMGVRERMLLSIGRSAGGRPRVMPPEVASRVYLANKAFYDEIGSRAGLSDAKSRVSASVILLSGCQDNQLSMDGEYNGAFTGALKAIWNGGKFKDGYDKFISAIRKQVNDPTQSPGIRRLGPVNATFDAQQPFLIND